MYSDKMAAVLCNYMDAQKYHRKATVLSSKSKLEQEVQYGLVR